MTRRIAALVALAAVIAAGLAVHRLLPSSVASDVTGDALYAVAAYSGLVLLLPRAPRPVPAAGAALWCIGVELLQLTGSRSPSRNGCRSPPSCSARASTRATSSCTCSRWRARWGSTTRRGPGGERNAPRRGDGGRASADAAPGGSTPVAHGSSPWTDAAPLARSGVA